MKVTFPHLGSMYIFCKAMAETALYRVMLELLVDNILTDAAKNPACEKGVKAAFAPEDPPAPVLDKIAEKCGIKGFVINFSAVKSGLFKYPLANPTPDIHSSPTAPIGCNLLFLSRIYMNVFAIGLPIGIFLYLEQFLKIKIDPSNIPVLFEDS